MKKLPKEIFVRWEHLSNEPDCLVAYQRLFDAVEDEPQEIGTYRLVEVRAARKVVETAKARRAG